MQVSSAAEIMGDPKSWNADTLFQDKFEQTSQVCGIVDYSLRDSQ